MLIYLAGGIAGSLTGTLAVPDGFHNGASSGVSALGTAHLANALYNWQEMKFPAYIYVGYILYAGEFVVGNGVFMYYKLVGEPTQVCVTGHIAGAVVGHLLGNVLLRLRDLRSYKTWKKAIWWFSLLMILVLFIGIILINIFYGGSIEDNRIFRMFDIDGDGLINEDELKTTIVSMSNRGKYITDWEVKAIIIDGDLDGDGKINFNEFQILVDNKSTS